jgi:hypothetical protein
LTPYGGLLPVQSTFWRFLEALHLNITRQILSVQQTMRERVWAAAHVKLKTVTLDTNTTVHTLYGQQMGGRKSYNPKNKGKGSYQPEGWKRACRFVALRYPKEPKKPKPGEVEQYQLLQTSAWKYRVFVTNLKAPIDLVAWFCKQRAGAENLIKEANNDTGLAAHPSGRFDVNRNHFQLAMLAYNLNCWHGRLVPALPRYEYCVSNTSASLQASASGVMGLCNLAPPPPSMVQETISSSV